MTAPRPLSAAEIAARLDALDAEVAALRLRLPARDPASTTAARLDLGPRRGRERAFGFSATAHEEDTCE